MGPKFLSPEKREDGAQGVVEDGTLVLAHVLTIKKGKDSVWTFYLFFKIYLY